MHPGPLRRPNSGVSCGARPLVRSDSPRVRTAASFPRPVESREERFTRPELDGVRLRAIHWGRSVHPTLILLHAAGANARWWDHLAPALAERFHVVALDFRGHGESDYPEERRDGAFAEDLAALIAHLTDGSGSGGGSAEEVRLVGHSLGAHVAARHASLHRVRSLALVEPSGGLSRTRRRAARLALMLRPTYATRARAVERYRFLPKARPAPQLRRAIAERSIRKEPDGRYGTRFDPRWFGVSPAGSAELERIACPTLLVRGAESTLLTAQGAAGMLARLPDARLVEIPDAGHHVQLDAPVATLEALRTFLGREDD